MLVDGCCQGLFSQWGGGGGAARGPRGYIKHLRWVPCDHGMACPQVAADGGDALQIWRVASNILNKQLRTANEVWSPAWWLGVGLTTPHCKK
jgi:hypothetical protein